MDSQKENNKHQKIISNLEWQFDIPDPVQGMCYIEPKLKHDFKPHDDSLEHLIPPTVHLNPLELFDIDYMGIVLSSFVSKEDIKLPESKQFKDQDFDYQKYIQESFDDVNDIEHPIDKSIGVKEIYDLFPSHDTSDLQIIQSDNSINIQKDSQFSIENCPNSNLYKMAVFKDCKYRCVKYKNSDYLILETEGDKIYFCEVDGIYRLTKD